EKKKSKKKEKVEAEAPAEDGAGEAPAEEEPPPPAEESPPAQEEIPPPPVEEPPPPAPEPEPEPAKPVKKKVSKKAIKNSSNIFDCFEQSEIEEFKAGFLYIDTDKDGIISKDDIRGCLDYIGRSANEAELDVMIAEAKGPINFTQLLTMFFARMSQAGEGDDNETIVNAFRCYEDITGRVDALQFREILMSGEGKFSELEADNALGEMDVEEGKIVISGIIAKLTGTAEEE
ncbi:unnamed protein product, partial [Allacma fusca]